MTWISVVSALWLGILTAISPCPLATNIAAISFIGMKTGQNGQVLKSGMLYALGRTCAYVIIGTVISAGLLGTGGLSRFLQKNMNEFMGPFLIILGMVLLGWIGSGISWSLNASSLQKKLETRGTIWALPLGALFALSFCPVSAGLFFGALIPLALNQQSSFFLPAVFGLGTSLPVVIFAFLLAFGAEYLGKVFDQVSRIEILIRGFAGTIFIVAGIYFCFIYIYGITS